MAMYSQSGDTVQSDWAHRIVGVETKYSRVETLYSQSGHTVQSECIHNFKQGKNRQATAGQII